MLICHRHRFIFIKTRKTAGSSTEIALSRLCGPDDIVTPLSARLGEEQVRRAEGGRAPVNWAKPLHRHRGVREWRRLLTRRQRASRFSQHATASEIRDWVGPEQWQGYLTLTIERNPWDRAVSRYWWQKFRWERRGRKDFPAVSEYLQYLAREKPHWISNWSHYANGDRILVDRVLFYESLQADLNRLQRDLGATDAELTLPQRRAKSGFRPDRQHYSEALSAEDRALIERLCAREIEAFGYTFDARAPRASAE